VATEHGQKLEPEAKDWYVMFQQKQGKQVTVEECGLFLHPDTGYFGASPDGLFHIFTRFRVNYISQAESGVTL